MGGINDLYESFVIYSESFSYFYIFCVCTSLAAVLFTWRIDGVSESLVDDEKSENADERPIDVNDKSQTNLSQNDSSDGSKSGLKLTHSNKRALLENLDDNLDEIELATEREIENQQLAHIFEFMKKEADKFDIGSVEELEDQMRQYYKK